MTQSIKNAIRRIMQINNRKKTFSTLLIFISLGFVACGTNNDSDSGIVIAPVLPTDTDLDTIADDVDNCVDIANTDQSDQDSDGIGDVCDPINDNIIPPAAPSGISASNSANCQITVSWADHSNNEDDFVLIRTFDIPNFGVTGQTTTIVVPANNTASVVYNDTFGPSASIDNVSYEVYARNAGGVSASVVSSPAIINPSCI
ncbi:hypothetical protein MRY82_09890 [bacterium]|nr:hypothetical protein [bacterium]